MGFDGLWTGKTDKSKITQPHGRRAPYYPVACKYRPWNTTATVSRETLRTLSTGDVIESTDHREHKRQSYNRYKTTSSYISFGDVMEYGLDKHGKDEIAYVMDGKVYTEERTTLQARAQEIEERKQNKKKRWNRAQRQARAIEKSL